MKMKPLRPWKDGVSLGGSVSSLPASSSPVEGRGFRRSGINNALQPLLWSKNVKKLDLVKDRVYIINQVLALGSWNHLKWLFKTYRTKEIAEIFLKYPLKIYPKRTFHFVKEILLEIGGKLPAEKYVQTLPRNIQ